MDATAYMLRAIELAEKARGMTSPNPLVGSVIVRDGHVVAEGYHHYYGDDHAEVDAMKQANGNLADATMFVSLEPCSHYGQTRPCAQAIIDARIKRVYAAMVDPNPKVAGKGISMLKDAGIEVEVGICENEARKLNEAYIKYITTGTPFVILKIAQTLDGRIADWEGNSKWITSEQSRRNVHLLRSQVDAVLVGAKTVRIDNPQLTTHGLGQREPLRVVVSSSGNLSDYLNIFKEDKDQRTVVVSSKQTLTESKTKMWQLDQKTSGRIDLRQLLKRAGEERITSLLVEGGAEIFSEFIREGLVDKYIFVVSPKLLGSGLSFFADEVSRPIGETVPLKIDKTYQFGDDLWVEAYPRT